ncbi:MAG TPA: FHA domain-containing protein [Alphaproteobacteria bacterium]|nr:FHA domain-containing protein [Alphaproteobacteria bacterium]
MSFVAQMRIGSLEITAMLAAAALVAARPRGGNAAEIAGLVPVKAVLRVIELGRERVFEGLCPLSIGRDRSCELSLADVEVSRKHARLESQGGVVFVRDLESSNGTFLNGRRLRSAIETREGDEIDVGTTRLIVEHLEPWT